ncbi:pancreatic triacylglycerol lipase [Nephila pilipes]|uniref:Pancreatic triacylglycerol lipase n=1 Tax=Nephila pilipes TaxID=299642 RepID=A0A8X6U0J6_NEPPI|nr:pancreatic triacylglycerol lipase [Nephila pilipes]
MSTFILTVLVAFGNVHFPVITDAQDLAQLAAIPGILESFADDLIRKIGVLIANPPINSNSSIQYLLFTPENPDKACYIQPTIKELNNCRIFPEYKTEVLIHGLETYLEPDNLYEKIKDRLLEQGNYNVIIVNWSKYGDPPFTVAIANTYAIGLRVGEMINFLLNNADINPADIHITGHSVGAHIAGIAGKNVANLGRITGLDPLATLFNIDEISNRLGYTDADFVDVIHTSFKDTGIGYGFKQPLGTVDFYPNGIYQQPTCQQGGNFTLPNGVIQKIMTHTDLEICNHCMALVYYLHSFTDCEYKSLQCDGYVNFIQDKCSGHFSNQMGFYAKNYEILPPKSKFYLTTSDIYPFC